MEVARTFLSSPPPFPTKTHHKNSLFSSSSPVFILREQAVPAAMMTSSAPVTPSLGRHFSPSVLLQEQRDESRPLLNELKEKSLARLDGRQMENETSINEELNSDDLDSLDFAFRHLLHSPEFQYMISSSETEKKSSLSSPIQSVTTTNTNRLMNAKPIDVINLAKRALKASKEATLLAENSIDCDNSVSTSLGSSFSSDFAIEDKISVRSMRRLERQSKNKRVSKLKHISPKPCKSRETDVKTKLNEGYEPIGSLRLFLSGPETKQLLTAKQEFEMAAQVQEVMRLEKVKTVLQSQFGREPSLNEWAEAVGLSSTNLRSKLLSARISREKLICSHLRLVVSVAKQYQGLGLSLQDLLQQGTLGLVKTVERYNPQAGTRFATYAYLWIRQTIRKGIFFHSRTIRLPENVHCILGKLNEAKRSYAREGNYSPSKEELAGHVGMTVNKLEELLFLTRGTHSLQQLVWEDQHITFQDITADPKIEIPDVAAGKQLMRRHIHGLLNTLKPRERRIIRLRFGIEDGRPKSHVEIGQVLGLSRLRIQQIEKQVLSKLKQVDGLKAYAKLLV